MKELDEIDHLFQETFDGFEVIPEPSVKERIDRSLASEKRRRRFLLIFLPLVAFSMATLIIGIVYLPSNQLTVVSPDKAGSVKTKSVHRYTKQDSFTVKSNTDEVVKESTREENSKHVELKNTHFYPTGKNTETNDRAVFEEQTIPATETNGSAHLLLSEINNADTDTITRLAADNSIDDSSEVNTSESLAVQDESLKNQVKTEAASRWYMSGFTGWEGEKAKSFESLNSNDLSSVGREFAGIRSSSFYGKVEMNYELPVGLDLIAGLGFRSTEVRQQATRYFRDSIPGPIDITTSAPTSYVYFAREEQGQQVFRVNSLIVPIGIAGSVAIGRSFFIRCAAGTEFSYGWLNRMQVEPAFSHPVFRPFGWNLWVRPELHYPIGSVRLIVYGTYNQAVYEQLKWEIASKRNPLFGAGIGVRVRL